MTVAPTGGPPAPMPPLMPMILPPPKMPGMPGQNVLFCYNPMMIPPPMPMPMGMMVPMMMPPMRMPVRMPPPVFHQPPPAVEPEASPLDLTTKPEPALTQTTKLSPKRELKEENVTTSDVKLEMECGSADEAGDSKPCFKKNMLQRFRGERSDSTSLISL